MPDRDNIAGEKVFQDDVTFKSNVIFDASYSEKLEVPAFEDLTAGAYVNIFNDSGTLKARLADASNPLKFASRYVNDTVSAGTTVATFKDGINPNISVGTQGDKLFLSDTTPGETTPTAPAAGTSFIQQLGEKLTGDNMEVEIQDVQGAAEAKFEIEASENLAAGDGVNLFDDGGTIKARKWDATAAGKEADGFVKAAVTSGQSATVFFPGAINDQSSGLTAGEKQFMDTTAGGVTNTAPSTSGNIVQEVGKALSATEYIFSPKKSTEKT